ncbi:acetamidase/formamidase family protein [Sulfodiicoccus acidiphilus]|nr:acetamidase/formamidase family protein [Sulfodiicoccus acidiphilus]
MLNIHAITHNKWDNQLPPIATANSGEEIEVETKEASDGQITPTSNIEQLRRLDFDRIHPLTGPIEVQGAEPGDALEVEFLEFEDMGWGWTAVLPGFGLLADEGYTSPVDLAGPALKLWNVKEGTARAKFGELSVRLPISPFPGVIGTALPSKGRFSTIPPRENGGNMDIKHLNTGSKLYLPVFVRGAMFSIGDTHLAQGDGEVCGTAVEAPMRIKLRVNVVKRAGIREPLFVTSGVREFSKYLAFPGMDSNMWVATKKAVKSTIAFLSGYMEPVEAYMLASTAVDLKVSEVVDQPTWIVTAYLPTEIFEEKLEFPRPS